MYLSPGLNSLENLVFFFLCFLFRLRIDNGMLFFRAGPLCNDAVELADDVMELVSSVSSAASSSDSRPQRTGHWLWGTSATASFSCSTISGFETGPLFKHGATSNSGLSGVSSFCCSTGQGRQSQSTSNKCHNQTVKCSQKLTHTVYLEWIGALKFLQ